MAATQARKRKRAQARAAFDRAVFKGANPASLATVDSPALNLRQREQVWKHAGRPASRADCKRIDIGTTTMARRAKSRAAVPLSHVASYSRACARDTWTLRKFRIVANALARARLGSENAQPSSEDREAALRFFDSRGMQDYAAYVRKTWAEERAARVSLTANRRDQAKTKLTLRKIAERRPDLG